MVNRSRKYDIVIIGAGPGGYVAAIRAAQLGAKVCVVEKDRLGGICLNKGCIPTKALIKSVEVLARVRDAPRYGVDISDWKIDFAKMQARKDEVVKKLVSGIDYLFKARRIDLIKGVGKLVEKGKVEVALSGGKKEVVEASKIIIATGSRPFELTDIRFDRKGIISSDEALELKEVPRSLLIIGGGVIGCEFAGIFNGLGTKVTIVEMMKQLLPAEDRDVARRLEAAFKKKKVKVLTEVRFEKAEISGEELSAKLSNGEEINSEKILVCIGRRANIEDIGLEDVGIEVDKGSIRVDDYLRTNIPDIYAIGDVIGGHLLAHVASAEGIVAAECAMGKAGRMDYTAVPNCIFTHPQIASCGLTEARAKEAGYDVRVGKFPFTALGKAQAVGQTEGLIKLVGDATSDKLLGAQIIGDGATDLIAELSLAIRWGMTCSQVADTIHAHPTFSEAVMEAAHNLHGRGIHSLE